MLLIIMHCRQKYLLKFVSKLAYSKLIIFNFLTLPTFLYISHFREQICSSRLTNMSKTQTGHGQINKTDHLKINKSSPLFNKSNRPLLNKSNRPLLN